VFARETFERVAEFGGETFLRGLGDFPRSMCGIEVGWYVQMSGGRMRTSVAII
jgi:hypothetical protein